MLQVTQKFLKLYPTLIIVVMSSGLYIAAKCDQIFIDAIVFEHLLAICDWKFCQLVTKKQYAIILKLKNYIQVWIWLSEYVQKLRKNNKDTRNLFTENPFPCA